MSVEEDTELRDLVAQTLEVNGVLNKIRVLQFCIFMNLNFWCYDRQQHPIVSIIRKILCFANYSFKAACLTL